VKKRLAVVFALFVMTVIFYIDRAAIASTLKPMSEDLGFSLKEKGWVLGVFALGYALGQVPGGWLADRYGPRVVLTACVAGWSLFTGLTGAVQGLTALLVARFLFGVAEAGALPACSRVFRNWLPVGERGRANGISFSGTRLGAAFSYPLITGMVLAWGWRVPYYVFAGAGLVWGAFWFFGFRDHPAEPVPQEAVSDAPPASFGKVLATRGMWLNMLQYFAGNFTFFLLISWMMEYLQRRYRLEASRAADLLMIPLLFAAGSMWVSGFVIDALVRTRGGRSWSLRLPGMAGFALAIAGLVGLVNAPTAGAAAAWLSLAVFGADLTIAPSWQYCVDVGGKNSAAVSGCMNMAGNLGAFLSPIAFSYLYVEATDDASRYFLTAAALNAVGVLCWLNLRSRSGAPARGSEAAGS
jgi:ACS family glucarate transporter-like MFS transporter